jgi:hypothetical protein
MKYWEIIAYNVSKAGWRLGRIQRLTPTGKRSGLRDNGKRFVVR